LSGERLAIDAQGRDAGRQGRRFHAEQFRCTAWTENLSVGLPQCVDDDLAFLPLKFVVAATTVD